METVYQVMFVGASVVTLASAVCAATPTPDPNTTLGKVYRAIEFLGLIVGKAKEQGVLPPDRKP